MGVNYYTNIQMFVPIGKLFTEGNTSHSDLAHATGNTVSWISPQCTPIVSQNTPCPF